MKKTEYCYDDRSFRLNVLRTTRNNGQDTLQDLNYYYDAVGNIVGEADHAQQIFYFANQEVEPVCNYTYDPVYRLLTATGREMTALQMPTHEDFPNNIPCPNPGPDAMQNYTQNYQYDALGNMLQMQSVGNWTRNYEYNNPMNNNYLLGHGNGTVYSYDAHGNMLTMPHLSNMSWDYLDQLHSATNGTFVSYYNYDAEGNRTRKVTEKGNITEIRYYIGNYELYQKYVNGSLDFERTTLNISDDEKVFVRIETKTGENPVIRYQYDNHLGSACLELDELGAIISYEEYHPFGTTSYRSGRSAIEVSLKRYKYCGKERDEETGLYYYGMRYYAAWLCRFVSVDPLQFKYPELTSYQYASNSPVTMIDLDGMEGEKPTNRISIPKKQEQEAKERKKYNNVFIKKVTKPLEKMLYQNETPEAIQAKADELAEQYQYSRWLRYVVDDPFYNSEVGGELTRGTGMRYSHKIKIEAFQIYAEKKEIVPEKERNGNPNKIIVKQIGMMTIEGSTLRVRYDPFGIEDQLKVYIINSLGEKKYILDTGMIVNKDNSIENIFEKEILITSETSGELYYEITHTDKPMLDNWKLNIEQEHQPVFNPIPLYDIKSVND